MSRPIVTINSRKFDGRIHRTWNAELSKQEGSLLEFVGTFEKEIVHRDLGIIRPGTFSYENYWFDRWYSIFRFHEPTGALRNFYCNVNLPPTFDNGILNYIDLDIDIVVWKDFSYQILDKDEFESSKITYSYSQDIITQVNNAIVELIRLIEQKEFPFNYKI